MLEFSDREIATFTAIARAKGAPSSVTPLTDALIEHNNLQPLNQGTTAADIPLVDHGCCTGPQSDHAVGQYPWPHYAMHSQMDPGLMLENWPLLGANIVSNQIPAPFQTDRHPPAEHAIWEVPVSYNLPVSNAKPFIGFSDPFSSFSVKFQMFSILQKHH
jgi:hypothetical protein